MLKHDPSETHNLQSIMAKIKTLHSSKENNVKHNVFELKGKVRDFCSLEKVILSHKIAGLKKYIRIIKTNHELQQLHT